MNGYAVNGQTATLQGFSGILYRATAMLAGYARGTFLTAAAASTGGFFLTVEALERGPRFVSRWSGSGLGVRHDQYAADDFRHEVKVPRESARVLRFLAVDGEAVTNAHRARVAALAKERHAKAGAFQKKHGDIGAALLARTDDAFAVALALDCLSTPDGSPVRAAWADAMREAKALALVTL